MLSELILRVLFFASIVTALVMMPWEFKIAALVLMVLRYFVVLFVTVRNARRLNEGGLALYHALFDIIEPILRFVIVISTQRKDKKWR